MPESVNLQTANQDKGISLLRVCSMLMIVLCHVFNYVSAPWLSQFFNVGVYVFLLMSGWLYSNKAIRNPRQWLANRWKKLCPPMWIWLFFVILYAFVTQGKLPEISDVLLFAFNLQGLSWVIYAFPGLHNAGVLGGVGHLWFVTVIFLCYVLLLGAKELEKRRVKISHPLCGILSALCFFALGFLRVNLSYFLCFFIGYALGKRESALSVRAYFPLSVGMILMIALRLTAKALFDGTVAYDLIIVSLTHTGLSVWIFYTVRLLEKNAPFFHRLACSGAVSASDKISFYVYITHNYFLREQFGLRDIFPGVGGGMRMLLFCALSLVSALCLKLISDRISACLWGDSRTS